MVKRKSEPKSKEKAGFAARTAAPVHDSTSSSSSSQGDSEYQEETQRQPSTSKRQSTSNRNPGATKQPINKVQKTIAKPDLKKKGTSNIKVLKDIRLLQKTTNLLIPRAPFLRLIKSLIQERAHVGMRVTEHAVEALREASESFLTNVFEDSYMLALHAKRVTLFPRDMNLLLYLRRDPASTA